MKENSDVHDRHGDRGDQLRRDGVVRASSKLAAYAAVLAIVVGGGVGIGAAAGPIDVGADDGRDDHPVAAGAHAEPGGPSGGAEVPGGLAVARDGYRLDVDAATLAGGEPAGFRFRVLDGAGRAVTGFEVEHEKRLHLVVVGRNLVDYAHLHPTLGEGGVWSVELPALPAGSYRAFADFQPTGAEALTLGVDLTVTGATTAAELPPPSRRADVGDYGVIIDGDARPGESELAFTVTRDGEAVRTDPYLGAAGHLVAIRDGDLAYLHVHPVDSEGDEVRFAAEFPSPGTYRLFLDFSHDGRVHTAAFTVEAPDQAQATDHATSATSGDEHESH
jgi:hypothetical protein